MTATLKDIAWWDRKSLFKYLGVPDKGQPEKEVRLKVLKMKNENLQIFSQRTF